MYCFTVFNYEKLTEKAPYPRCHLNLPVDKLLSLIQLDDSPFNCFAICAIDLSEGIKAAYEYVPAEY